jgi:hypothetical protein
MGIEDSLSATSFVAAMDMMSAGIVGLAFILLIVFCVLAAKTWHWVNIVFVILTFLSGLGAIWGLTQVYSKRTDAVKKYDDAIEKLERAEKDADLKILGDPTSVGYDPGTLRYIDGVLAREMAGRGRVWSRGKVSAGEQFQRVFTFATPRPDDYAPLEDTVLFAFLELPAAGQLHPTGFIGSVRVVEETPQTVTVQPVAIADVQQYGKPDAAATWSLFEKMPLDRRGTFKRAIIALAAMPNAQPELVSFASQLQDKSAELNISQFRNILKVQFLRPEIVGLAPDSIEYEQLIDRYAFDELSLGAINGWIESSQGRKGGRFEPGPDEIFVKYEFNEPSKKAYQVDSNGAIETDGQFNQLGHAIDPALQAGGEIRFAKGDTVLVDKNSADGYQRGEQKIVPFSEGENVKKADEIYIRQVRDYPFEFVNVTIRGSQLDGEIARFQKNNTVQQAVLDDANAQLNERLSLTADLEADKTGLSNDFDRINEVAEAKEQKVSQLRQQITSLTAKIDAIYTQIRELSVTLSRQAFAGR